MLRFLLWRLLGVLAVLCGVALVGWFLNGGPGSTLRGPALPRAVVHHARGAGYPGTVAAIAHAVRPGAPAALDTYAARSITLARPLVAGALAVVAALALIRVRARHVRRYVRLRIDPYRGDRASVEGLVAMYEALHKRLLRRWWQRLLSGQPSVALEVHHPGVAEQSARQAWLGVCCPAGLEAMIEAALQTAYTNCRLSTAEPIDAPRAVLRLKKHAEFIKRVKVLDRHEHERDPPMNRLLTLMGACGKAAFVQLAITPAPLLFERFARHLFERSELRAAGERGMHMVSRGRSMVEESELRGGLDVQHRPLFFVDLRIAGPARSVCERIASELRAAGAENRLVERGTTVRHGLLGLYGRRTRRGEGNPLPPVIKGVFSPTELAAIWQMPSTDYATVPFARSALPIAPAPPPIMRPTDGTGTLQDGLGVVSIHEQLRKQNTAVPGTVEQGKTSYLVATAAEDLRRRRCALIVLDPKGDAAEATLSLVAIGRTCTLLDFADPTCGFNPLAVDAPADVIADYVVAALKNLFSDADIRASSDRYLRNAIIAVLAYDRSCTLWDAARILSVGEEGYSFRRRVAARVRALPEMKEISAFFTAELTAQLADARSSTTSKLDAPVNKLARLLNSASIKRVLLNESLRVDFDRVIANHEVLVVKGALGAMGAGNTSVLMQLLIGMLDAALARQQDLVPAEQRIAVALKIDEAPLVINRGFAETMALKRSAGLETVACWQTDAQWADREVRDQLDALFAHRVYFATASARDARDAVRLTMAEFSDTVRPGMGTLSALGQPDVRMRLPKHHAIASWVTSGGRQPAFIAQTIPLRVDPERVAIHAAHQRERGGRRLADLRQPHWDRLPAAAPREDSLTPAATSRGMGRPPLRREHPGPARQTKLAHVRSAGPAPASLRELAELDRAHSVRWAARPAAPTPLEPDGLDLEVLTLVARLGHVLTSQIHRRFNAGRAVTTTQRRLKRLSDAGLVDRFQFHRPDGGGVPMCYVASPAGLQLLTAHGGRGADPNPGINVTRAPDQLSLQSARGLRQARHDAHVAGAVLALEHALATATPAIRGAGESAVSPPVRSTPHGRVAMGPADLRLPGGRVPHDFLRPQDAGAGVEAERFETVRPDAIVQLADPRAVDLMIELDDRMPAGRAAGKVVRYDHFLSGWSVHTERYGPRLDVSAVVLFICRDRVRSRDCARLADSLLTSCRAYPGEYPFDWEYPGREQMLFLAERDVHECALSGYGVPRLPPEVRVAAAHGDPHAAQATAEPRALLDVTRRSTA